MAASEPDSFSGEQAGQVGLFSAISNEMVQIYKAHFGRGPTRTRTRWADGDTIVVTLESTLTAAERKLVALGEHGRVRELRTVFQYTDVAAFCEPIERLTGRKVRAFLSVVDVDADVASETFLLHPTGYDGPSRLSTPGRRSHDRQHRA